MGKLYDVIIIGAGPAGITASVYAARKKMDLLVITDDIGGQAAWSGDIENYTGYQFVTGVELSSKFEEHMKKYGIAVKEGEKATHIDIDGNVCVVSTEKDEYRSKTVIIASGKRSKELNIRDEAKFRNKGLTYCATCDGPLFAGKEVAIIGGGNSALDAALQLMKIARKVFIINITPELGGDAIMREKVSASDNVTVINNAQVTGIQGDVFVEKIKISEDGSEREIPVQGIFVEIGLIPNSSFAEPLERNERGEIIVDSYNQTNIPGIFAAGDVTDVPEKQIIIAAGEGAKAALGTFAYISKTEEGDW
ncbi:MAG: FAD-dependent oxidoreductase [Candidatus Omnitrophota bacterium]